MGVLPLGQGADLVRHPRPLQAVPHTLPVHVPALGHVFRHRAGQRGELLEHGGEQLVVVPAVILPDVLPVQQHQALRGVQQAAHELDEGGLARAVFAHHRQLLPGADGQADVGEGVRLCAGVAVGHVPQLDGVQVAGLDGQGCAVLKAEGLRRGHKLPQGGQVQALAVEGAQVGEDARHPLGEAAHGGEVQHELGGGQLPPEGQGDEPAVGRAVAQQGQGHVQQVGPQIAPLGFDAEVLEHLGIFVVELEQPGSQAENAHVLGQLGALALVHDAVGHAAQPALLLPVAVAPGADALPGEVARRGQRSGEQGDGRPRLGEQQQVDGEAHQVGGQAGQGVPHSLPRVVVGGVGPAGLCQALEVVRVLDVGVGGATFQKVLLDGQHPAHADPAEEGVGVQIRLKGVDAHQPQGELGDQDGQLPGGHPPAHRVQDHGGDEQLQQAGGHSADDEPCADEQNALGVPPGPGDHERAVRGHAVGGLLLAGFGFFHVSHLVAYGSTKAPGRVNRGLN